MGDTIFGILFWIAVVGFVIWYMSRSNDSKSKISKLNSSGQPSQTENWLLENIQNITYTQDFRRISTRLCDYCGVSEYCYAVS